MIDVFKSNIEKEYRLFIELFCLSYAKKNLHHYFIVF